MQIAKGKVHDFKIYKQKPVRMGETKKAKQTKDIKEFRKSTTDGRLQSKKSEKGNLQKKKKG